MAKISPYPKRYVSPTSLLPLFEFLREIGVDWAQILSAINVRSDDLHNNKKLIPAIAYDIAFELAAIKANNPLIGFHAAQQVRPAHYGTTAYIVMCGRNMREVLDLFIRYRLLLGNGAHITYKIKNGMVEVYTLGSPETTHFSRQAHEFNLTCWTTIVRWMAGTDLRPTRVELSYREESDYSAMRDYFGCDFAFNCEAPKIYFPEALLEVETITANASILSLLRNSADEKLQELPSSAYDSFLHDTREYVSKNLVFGYPTIEETAKAVRVDHRKLQQILKESGTSYREMVDNIRRNLSTSYLKAQDTPIVNIALMLGYSEQSAFHHAFKRWYGIAPVEFRQRMAR